MTTEELQRTRVGFDHQVVEVVSNIASVHEQLGKRFLHMIGTDEDPVMSSLALTERENTFMLEGSAFTAIHQSTLGPLLHLVPDEIRMEFMRGRPDLLWLHAAAVANDNRALVILGASGQGKSTLSTMLSESGWAFMSDDVLPISMNEDLVYPFPQMPSRRIPSETNWSVFELGTADRDLVSIPVGRVVSQPLTIGEMVFPVFRRGSGAFLERLTRGDAAIEILRNATNFCDHKAQAVERSARLTQTIPAFRLTYSSRGEAVRLLQKLRSG